MKLRHEHLLAQFTEQFDQDVIDRWTAAIEAWDQDLTKPNPYEETEKGVVFWFGFYCQLYLLLLASSMAAVRLELAEQELIKASRGTLPLHDVSLNNFLQMGLELEEQQ